MCGLSGCFGDVTYAEEKVFKTMLVFSHLRGSDSTGAASVSMYKENGEFKMKLAKEIGPFPYLFDRKAFDNLFHGTNSVYIGHNRSKTVGDVSRSNAHPFQFDDVIGAHNGTLDYQNKNRLEGKLNFKTDSEALFNNVQENGIEDTIGKIDQDQAYALTWYDKRNHTMNFIRNDKRPLVYCYANDKKTIFYASTYAILMAAMYSENIKIDGNVREFAPDSLYTWQIPTSKNEPLKEPTRRKLEGREPTKWSYNKKKEETTTFSTSQMTGAGGYKPGQMSHAQNHSTDLKDDDDMENGGLFVGMVPKKQPETAVTSVYANAASKVIAESRDKLKQSMMGKLTDMISGKSSATDKNKEASDNAKGCLAAADVVRLRAFGDANNAGLIPDPVKAPNFLDGKFVKVYRNIADGMWISLKYNPVGNAWDRHETATPPAEMSFKIVDINSQHMFRHIGRKKNKKIFYKGWKKDLLVMDRFEKIMQEGCLNCARRPEWGNEVTFVSENHDFLCEYCKLTPGLVDSFFGEKKEEINNPIEKKAA